TLFRSVQSVSQLQGRLTAQLDDHAFRLFVFDYVVKVFPEDGLEVELIGDVEVCGYGLRVTVDHDRLVSAFFCSEYAVHTAVVELDSLTNAVRTRTQYNHFLCV